MIPYQYIIPFILGLVMGWRGHGRLLTIVVASLPLALYETLTIFMEKYMAIQDSWWSWLPGYTEIQTTLLVVSTFIQFIVLAIIFALISLVGHYIGLRIGDRMD